MNTQLTSSKRNSIWCSETINRIEQHLFTRHLVTDTIINICRQSLVSFRQLDTKTYRLMSKSMNIRSTPCCLGCYKTGFKFLVIIVEPMVITWTQKRMFSAQARVIVE